MTDDRERIARAAWAAALAHVLGEMARIEERELDPARRWAILKRALRRVAR